MKAFRILGRNIRDAFKSVFRNFSLSLASISCITITLIVVSVAIILTYNVNNFASEIKKNLTIVVFLDDINSKDQKEIDAKIDDIVDKINEIKGVNKEETKKVPKDEVKQKMIAESNTFQAILENIDENPLQDTILVKVENIEEIGRIAEEIKNIDGVESYNYGKEMVNKLINVFKVIKNISIGVVVALIIVTAFLIANTIKITIFSRKREIEIMRLVGASNINIKIPFIFEGLFLGILGSIIPIAVTTYGYIVLYKYFDGKFLASFIKLVNPEPFIYLISIVLLLIGIIVGMFGSLRAVKKHLKI